MFRVLQFFTQHGQMTMHLDTVYLCAVSEDCSILLLEITEQVKLCAMSPCWIA